MEEKVNKQQGLPHDGVVVGIRVSNVSDFVEIFKERPYKVLYNLEKSLVGMKIRKISKNKPITYIGGLVMFDLSGFEKVNTKDGVDEYLVTYRYSAIQ